MGEQKNPNSKQYIGVVAVSSASARIMGEGVWETQHVSVLHHARDVVHQHWRTCVHSTDLALVVFRLPPLRLILSPPSSPSTLSCFSSRRSSCGISSLMTCSTSSPSSLRCSAPSVRLSPTLPAAKSCYLLRLSPSSMSYPISYLLSLLVIPFHLILSFSSFS